MRASAPLAAVSSARPTLTLPGVASPAVTPEAPTSTGTAPSVKIDAARPTVSTSLTVTPCAGPPAVASVIVSPEVLMAKRWAPIATAAGRLMMDSNACGSMNMRNPSVAAAVAARLFGCDGEDDRLSGRLVYGIAKSGNDARVTEAPRDRILRGVALAPRVRVGRNLQPELWRLYFRRRNGRLDLRDAGGITRRRHRRP